MSLIKFKKFPQGPSISDVSNIRKYLGIIYGHLNGNVSKEISEATYTIKESDSGSYLYFTATCTITLPNTFVRLAEIMVINKGSGTLTFSATGTLESTGTELATQFSAATLKHEGSGVWGVYGLD